MSNPFVARQCVMISTINISRASASRCRYCHTLLLPRHRSYNRLTKKTAHSAMPCNYLFSSSPQLGNPDVLTCRPNSRTEINGLWPRYNVLTPPPLRRTCDTKCPIKSTFPGQLYRNASKYLFISLHLIDRDYR